MSRIEQLASSQDNTKLEQMAADGWQCVQVFFDGQSWLGLFFKK